ncbi:hypothetical protein ACTXT7_011372 [Hymenolepis weldensis]
METKFENKSKMQLMCTVTKASGTRMPLLCKYPKSSIQSTKNGYSSGIFNSDYNLRVYCIPPPHWSIIFICSATPQWTSTI